jgi:hypothetical protein
MATTDFFIRPEDGWVLVATAPDYIQIKPGAFHPWWVFVSSGDPATEDVSEVPASVSITFNGQPSATEVIVVGSVTYEFDDDVAIGADAEETRDNLLAALGGNSAVTAVADGADTITLTATASGSAGNSVTLTTTATNIAVSGSGTLSGGVDEVTTAVGLPFGRDSDGRREAFELPVGTGDKVYIRIKEPTSREPATQAAHFAVLVESA